MKKIYALQKWYSLEEAAERLSLSVGEHITCKTLLQFAVEGHVNLSCYFNHQTAKEVAPFCIEISEELRLIEERFNSCKKSIPDTSPPKHYHLGYATQQINVLDGMYKFDINTCGALKNEILSYLTGNVQDICMMDGYHVKDKHGSLWQILEEFSSEDIKGMFKDERLIPLYDERRYFPSPSLPPKEHWGIQKEDLEALEEKLTDDTPTLKKPDIHPRERNTMLKIILGMAIKGYAYNPLATKNSTASEVACDLAEAGIPVSDDTIRKLLIEANALLPNKSRIKP